MRWLTSILFYLYYLFLIALFKQMAIYMFGDYGGRDTPGYIPNPEVKPARA